MAEIYKLDILKKEQQERLPYWLDARQTDTETMKAIRQKHRDRWLAKQQKEKSKTKP